jgi:hypothetical protein
MGRPGTGLDGRIGIPGRGAAGIPGPAGAPGRCVSLATRSGRGGTTGRAAGCPARFGFAGGRRGPPLDGAAPGTLTELGAEGGRGPGRGGVGMLGMGLAIGRGVPGVACCGIGNCGAAVLGASDGIGCRGPVRICPGLGAGGAGREGIGIPRGLAGIGGGAELGGAGGRGAPGLASGGITGAPPELSGGRIGAVRAGGGVSTCSFAAVSTCCGAGARSTSIDRGGGADSTTGADSKLRGSGRGDGESTGAPPASSPWIWRRTNNAWSSSRELE